VTVITAVSYKKKVIPIMTTHVDAIDEKILCQQNGEIKEILGPK